MKFSKIALAAFLAIASFEAVARPSPKAIAEADAFCNSPGQPCHKIKRVAEALAAEPTASEERDAKGRSCGSACLKEKLEADPIANKKYKWCWLPGEACFKAKRQLEAAFIKL